jgi:hypothetical protein
MHGVPSRRNDWRYLKASQAWMRPASGRVETPRRRGIATAASPERMPRKCAATAATQHAFRKLHTLLGRALDRARNLRKYAHGHDGSVKGEFAALMREGRCKEFLRKLLMRIRRARCSLRAACLQCATALSTARDPRARTVSNKTSCRDAFEALTLHALSARYDARFRSGASGRRDPCRIPQSCAD